MEPECLETGDSLRGGIAERRTPVRSHDVFLNDSHDGPLPPSLSILPRLFSITQGRAYSRLRNTGNGLSAAGLQVSAEVKLRRTLIHCGVLTGTKP